MIALDLSRLLSRAGFPTPTGIDRVELAYARHLLASGADHCFAAINALGTIGALPQEGAARLVDALASMWRGGATASEMHQIATLARRLRRAALFGARALEITLKAHSNPAYLLVSHSHLSRTRGIARLKQGSGARFVCLIHDLIPLDYPQYTSAAQTRRHRRRIETVDAVADAVIVNSAATKTALLRWIKRDVAVTIAPLGFDFADRAWETPEPAYFVCLGTIEPRKNHALLLDVWQRLVAGHGNEVPRLLVIGRRGWGSKAIARRLANLRPFVSERAGLSDAEVASLLRGARAMLLPSFAEGFGLPVVEALANGAPVLCSDLPALRESGGGVPDYLDPQDPNAWEAAVLDYTVDSPRHAAQLARLARWQAPRWNEHFAVVDRFLVGLSKSRGPPRRQFAPSRAADPRYAQR